MSVALLCPACGHAHTDDAAPDPERCEACHAPLGEVPPAGVARPRPAPVTVERPVLVAFFLVLSTLAAPAGPAGLVLAAFTDGPVRVQGREITGLSSLLDVQVLLALALVMLPVAIAWGGWRQRRWTRHAMFAVALAFAALQATAPAALPSQRLTTIAFALPYLLVSGWYLYLKPNVVAYFRACR